MHNAVKIFEENKILYKDFDDKTIKSEFWKEKNILNHKKLYENFIYKSISLFVIKNLDARCNPETLTDYIKDSKNISSNFKNFSFMNISDKDLSYVNISKADLSYSNLSSKFI